MMNQTVDEFNRAGSRMAGDIKTVIADGEELLKAAADVPGEGFAAVRQKFEEKFANARAKLADASRAAIEKTRETAAATDAYVHHSPWTAVGVAAAAGILIGILAARR
ncbi:MAG TPA: DUF883 family protein [Burkholderiales bacterium]|nr:DUF883 family protein [Burkholderiales bacterium]